MSALERIVLDERGISSALFENLPRLRSLRIDASDQLRSVQFQKLPKLEELTVKSCPHVLSVDVSELTNLKSLAVNLVPAESPTPTPYPLPDRSRPINFIGLANLTRLEELHIGGVVVNRRNVAEIATLTGLQALRLPATWLDDPAVMQFSSLRKLTSLEIAGNAFTDAALADIGKLPQLKELWVNETLVSHAAVGELSGRFSNLNIYYDWQQSAARDFKERTKQGARKAGAPLSTSTNHIHGADISATAIFASSTASMISPGLALAELI